MSACTRLPQAVAGGSVPAPEQHLVIIDGWRLREGLEMRQEVDVHQESTCKEHNMHMTTALIMSGHALKGEAYGGT